MATRVYQNALVLVAQQNLDWANDTIKIIALNSGYTFDVTHTYVSDLTPGANEISGTGYVAGFAGSGRQVGTNGAIVPDVVDGIVDFTMDDFLWPGVGADTGTWSGWALWVPVTSDADSPLICFGDPGDIIPVAEDVVLAFFNGVVFKLSPLL